MTPGWLTAAALLLLVVAAGLLGHMVDTLLSDAPVTGFADVIAAQAIDAPRIGELLARRNAEAVRELEASLA